MNKLILHKIYHKPLLIEKIFPYTINRPLIFQILLKYDLSLKESLKSAFKSLKKSNNLDDETNETFKRFISYRLIFEKNLYEKYLLNFDYILNSFKEDIYFNFIQRYFFKIINRNMDIKYRINKDETINNFVLDYFQYHKKMCLYIFPGTKTNLYLIKKIKYTELDIDLIFFINDNKFLSIDIKSELINKNFKVKNIYFVLDKRKNLDNNIIFEHIKEYIDIINKMKNKKDIIKISLKYLGQKQKIFINYLYENNLCINLENLEKVEYNENIALYDKINLRYKLNYIFNKNFFFNLIILTSEDFNNIKEIKEEKKKYLVNKLNFFKHYNNNNTELKIMFFDFQNNSPYDDNFIYFCEKYLSDIYYINTIIIRNIGKTNYKTDCKKNIQKPLIKFNILKNIIYEKKNNINNETIENEIKKFFDLFFYTDNLFYKINTDYILIYSDDLEIFEKINVDKANFDNIIYEIIFQKELTIKMCENINNNINIFNIIKTLKKLKKDFNKYLKGDIDMINQINSFNLDCLDSYFLKDKKLYDIIIKELGTLRTIFKFKKIYEGNPNWAKIRQKLFNKKNVYKIAIFKTVGSDIFGFCFKPNYKKNASNSNYSFLFTSNKDIFYWDDDMYEEDGPFFIKEYLTDYELISIKDRVLLLEKQFVDKYIINYYELFFLKKFL